MDMSSDSMAFNWSGFKKGLINPSAHAPGAAVTHGGSSVRATASFSRVVVFMQRNTPAVRLTQDA